MYSDKLKFFPFFKDMNWFTLFTYFCSTKSIFDKVSNDCSKLVIKRYSTSFYFSSSLLSKTIRQDIFNIYGFVRLADEIVDTFHGFPKKELLEDGFSFITNSVSLS